MRTGLYIIEQEKHEPDRLFWNRNIEHGTGWNPHTPKQSFTKSELVKEVFFICDNFSTDIAIKELRIK